MDKQSTIISVVRHPKECFASDASKEILNKTMPIDIDFSNLCPGFVVSMAEIYDYADIIVDFNELVNDPDFVLTKIASKLGLEISNIGQDVVIEDNSGGFIPTSKNLSNYDYVYKRLESADLSSAIEAYENVLSKAI